MNNTGGLMKLGTVRNSQKNSIVNNLSIPRSTGSFVAGSEGGKIGYDKKSLNSNRFSMLSYVSNK